MRHKLPIGLWGSSAVLAVLVQACGADPQFSDSGLSLQRKADPVSERNDGRVTSSQDAQNAGTPAQQEGNPTTPVMRAPNNNTTRIPLPPMIAAPPAAIGALPILVTTVTPPLTPNEPITSPISESPEPEPAPEQEIAALCASNRLRTRTIPVVFAEQNGGCQWGQNGNLGARDGIVRARLEQSFELELRRNETLCGFSINSPEQQISFDDEMTLTFNDQVLMSSYNYNDLYQEQDGLFEYSWTRIIDAFNPGPATPVNPYCLGNSAGSPATCTVPQTQISGIFSLAVPELESLKLSRIASEQNRAQLGLIITGDDDSADCSHSEISMTVEVKYVNRTN